MPSRILQKDFARPSLCNVVDVSQGAEAGSFGPRDHRWFGVIAESEDNCSQSWAILEAQKLIHSFTAGRLCLAKRSDLIS